MKKCLLIILSLSLLYVFPACAHSIKDVKLEYNTEEKALTVTIEHISRDRRKEYIRKVVIYKNGKIFKEEYYNLQKDPAVFEETYEIEAEIDDELKVKAFAAEGGIKEESIKVKAVEILEEGNKNSDKLMPAPNKGSGY